MNDEPSAATPSARCLRLFVAMPVPVLVRTELANTVRELAAAVRAANISWTRPENMHLTLRFLGDVSAADLDPLAERLATAIRDFGDVPLVCERLGTFPDSRRPRILWGGVHDAGPGERLAEVARRVIVATTPFAAEPAEARFTGHITIGRIRQIRRAEVSVLSEHLERECVARRLFGSWTADRIELIQSELGPGGSRYTTLREFPLMGSGIARN